MANGDIISSLKKTVIKEITTDDTLFAAIDAQSSTPSIENGGDLIDTYIFKFNKNPYTVKDIRTFLTVMVSTYADRYQSKFVIPTLTIFIYSHWKHMDIKNIPGIDDTRMDYIGKLLDLKFNGFSSGIGKLNLVTNEEMTFNKEFLCRKLVFETIDINDSFCEE